MYISAHLECTCGTLADMEVPITRFRRELFSLVETALDGKEVWVRHKGRRLRLVPEDQPTDKLSRITPLEIIANQADLEDQSWKISMLEEWDRKWDRRLGTVRKAPKPARSKSRKARRTA